MQTSLMTASIEACARPVASKEPSSHEHRSPRPSDAARDAADASASREISIPTRRAPVWAITHSPVHHVRSRDRRAGRSLRGTALRRIVRLGSTQIAMRAETLEVLIAVDLAPHPLFNAALRLGERLIEQSEPVTTFIHPADLELGPAGTIGRLVCPVVACDGVQVHVGELAVQEEDAAQDAFVPHPCMFGNPA
jgi:hypothetical protein